MVYYLLVLLLILVLPVFVMLQEVEEQVEITVDSLEGVMVVELEGLIIR